MPAHGYHGEPAYEKEPEILYMGAWISNLLGRVPPNDGMDEYFKHEIIKDFIIKYLYTHNDMLKPYARGIKNIGTTIYRNPIHSNALVADIDRHLTKCNELQSIVQSEYESMVISYHMINYTIKYHEVIASELTDEECIELADFMLNILETKKLQMYYGVISRELGVSDPTPSWISFFRWSKRVLLEPHQNQTIQMN